MNDPCQRYAEDPEANAAHLRECAKCREIYGQLDAPIVSQAVRVDVLPLAPWEGAGYRSWPLVIGGVLAMLAIALGLCALAGISLAAAIRAGARLDWRALLEMANGAVRPLGPIGFAVLFVVVNTLLVALLRRSPRGIDA
jgi:hypothetical protein